MLVSAELLKINASKKQLVKSFFLFHMHRAVCALTFNLPVVINISAMNSSLKGYKLASDLFYISVLMCVVLKIPGLTARPV